MRIIDQTLKLRNPTLFFNLKIIRINNSRINLNIFLLIKQHIQSLKKIHKKLFFQQKQKNK